MLRLSLVAILLIVSTSAGVENQATTVFKGRPSVKVSEGGVERLPEQIPSDRAANLECVISEISGRFYWASRENKEMIRVETGAFITFIAANGAGYVRIVNPAMKAAASLMSETEKRFDYVEHALVGLRSVTYYGNAR